MFNIMVKTRGRRSDSTAVWFVKGLGRTAWGLLVAALGMARSVIWFVFLRPPRSPRSPRRWILAGRLLLAAFLIFAGYWVMRYSPRYYGQVLTAYKWRFQFVGQNLLTFGWWVRPAKIDVWVREAARTHGVSEDLIHAVIESESNYRNYAISRTGACGLMQLQPATVRLFAGGNPFDPRQNIDAGTRFLAALRRQFKGNLDLMAAAYNAGPAAVVQYKGVPPYRETREYVKRVRAAYARRTAGAARS